MPDPELLAAIRQIVREELERMLIEQPKVAKARSMAAARAARYRAKKRDAERDGVTANHGSTEGRRHDRSSRDVTPRKGSNGHDSLADMIEVAEKRKRSDASGARIGDWIPGPEGIAFCQDERPDLDPQALWEEFRDYWAAVPGQRGRKIDWMATWRNRVRSAPRARR